MSVNHVVFNEIRVAVFNLFMGTDKNFDRRTGGWADGRTDVRTEEAILIRFPYSCYAFEF